MDSNEPVKALYQPLKAEEKEFARLVVDGSDPKMAYRTAFDSPDATSDTANGMKLQPNVRMEIQRLKAERATRNIVDVNRVLREYLNIADANIADYIDDNGYLFSPEKIKTLPRAKTKVIQSMKQTISKGTVTTEVKLCDKMTALAALGRHVGIDKDNSPVAPTINIVVPGGLLNVL